MMIILMTTVEPEASLGALVTARALRQVATIGKAEFDAEILRLARSGEITLAAHDYPMSLSQADRDELVADEYGNYYVGMAIR